MENKRQCIAFVVDEMAHGRRQCIRASKKGSSYCKRHLTKMKRAIPEKQRKAALDKYAKTHRKRNRAVWR